MAMPATKVSEMNLEAIGLAMKGSLSGPGSASPRGFSIDSRSLRPGDLFFAIVGPNHDGHRFAADAVARGATGIVASDEAVVDRLKREGRPVIAVKDTLRALQDLAAHVRRMRPVKVVGVTGSSGKTTTKEMTRAAVEAAFSVHASRGNFNNLYGCPLSILEIGEHHQVSVLEMGMSTHGELERLAEIADPDIGILTNVTGAHLVNFESVEDVASAKGELFEGMRTDSIGIFNNDDEHCRRIMGSFKGYAVTFGIDRPSDLVASDYRAEGLEGSSFLIRHAQKSGTRRVKTRFVGIHNVYNALAAMSAGYMLGIDLEAMAASLAGLSPLGMRGQVVRLGESVRILDESYNSNPVAMRYALKMLEEAGTEGRKILVFGDMLELGESEVEAHRELGPEIRAAGPDVVVGVGPLAAETLSALEDCIVSPNGKLRMHRFEGSEEASRFVTEMARPGDLFLVKGSRGVALEKVVAALRERFGEE